MPDSFNQPRQSLSYFVILALKCVTPQDLEHFLDLQTVEQRTTSDCSMTLSHAQALNGTNLPAIHGCSVVIPPLDPNAHGKGQFYRHTSLALNRFQRPVTSGRRASTVGLDSGSPGPGRNAEKEGLSIAASSIYLHFSKERKKFVGSRNIPTFNYLQYPCRQKDSQFQSSSELPSHLPTMARKLQRRPFLHQVRSSPCAARTWAILG